MTNKFRLGDKQGYIRKVGVQNSIFLGKYIYNYLPDRRRTSAPIIKSLKWSALPIKQKDFLLGKH